MDAEYKRARQRNPFRLGRESLRGKHRAAMWSRNRVVAIDDEYIADLVEDACRRLRSPGRTLCLGIQRRWRAGTPRY